MKIMNRFWNVCLVALTALFSFIGCTPEEDPVEPQPDPVEDPVIRLVTAEVKAPAEGGDFFVEYAIENPVEGVAVKAECNEKWIVDLSMDHPGKIAFSVVVNGGEAREGKVSVKYEGAQTVSFKVLQEAAAPVPDTPFRIAVKEIKETSALLDILPEDRSMTYLYFVKMASELAEGGIETDEQLFEADKVFLQKDADYYGDTFSNTVNYYSHQGDCVGEALKNMIPSTEYVVYAYGIELKGDELTRLTDVARSGFTTKSVPQIEVDFDFDIQLSGAVADVKVTANDYNGPFYFDVLEEFTENTDITQAASGLWMKMTSILFEVGYAPADIIEQLCDFNEGAYRYELEGNKEYILFAVAISDEMALPCSKADYEPFATDGVSASENEITVSVENVTSTSVKLVFETTNDDPYAAALIETDQIRGMSDQEIIEAYIAGGDFNTVNGNTSIDVPGLTAGTEYTVLAFGYSGGVMTTGFFRCEFKTAPGGEQAAAAGPFILNCFNMR